MKDYQRTVKTEREAQKSSVKKDEKSDDFISPMDFWDMDIDQPIDEDQPIDAEQPMTADQSEQQQPAAKKHQQGLFVIGTDAVVGKTVAINALGTLLRQRHIDVAAMKPIGSSEEGARAFINAFDMKEDVNLIAPYAYAEKISPYFAFQRHQIIFDMKKVVESYQVVSKNHEVTLVEGTGGLLDPLSDQLTVADLIKELGLGVIIVAPLRRGILSHLLMITDQARRRGLMIQGVLFTEPDKAKPPAFFQAKVQAVKKLVRIPVIGIIPFLEKGSPEEVQEKCQHKIAFAALLNVQRPSRGSFNKRRRRPRSARRRPSNDGQDSSVQQAAQEKTNAPEQSS